MKKYFALDISSGELRLVFVGEFEECFEAIEFVDSKPNETIWVLSEDDFKILVNDFNNKEIRKC